MPRSSTEIVHADRADTLEDVAEATMPESATIKRKPRTLDAAGGVADAAYATVATAVPCRLSAVPAGDERTSGGRRAVITDWNIAFTLGTDVTALDRVTIGTRTFEVISAPSPQSYDPELRVQAREVA